jgi:DNA polymerase III delta prime subunit
MSDCDVDGWNEEYDEVKTGLIELYLNVKVRSKDEINKFTEDQLLEERDKLNDSSLIALINYVKSSIEILMNLKIEDYLEMKRIEKEEIKERKKLIMSVSSSVLSVDPPQDYEELIQKYEGDIRKHIRIEQQMKLHSESLQQKLEDKEKEITAIQKDLSSLKEEYDREK